MYLITETISDISVITEDIDGRKEVFLTGVFLESERKNRNGRIYPKSILEREINRYKTDFVNTNRAFGELSHPTKSEINPDRISHLVTEIHSDGNDFRGKTKLLNTPCGNIVRGIVEGGGQFGISSRGMGSTKSVNGINEVQNDYDFVCLDLVPNPSGIDCFTEMVMENSVWVPKAYEIKEDIADLTSKDLHDPAKMLSLFEKYMGAL